ncbi:MAG: ABC transporter ATP-binding protein/permease [Methanomicrobiales archaeon]|nr:ABC transporter ATP-binding protein/permease [Methanomicrobiales archaeon]
MIGRLVFRKILGVVPREPFRDFFLMGKYMLPYWQGLALFVVLAIVCAFFEAVSLGALVPLVQMMESPEEPGGTLWEILNTIFSAFGIPLTFTTLLALITILFLIGQILLFVKKKTQVNLRVSFIQNMKVAAFRAILSADISFHKSRKTGNFVNLLVTEIENAGYGLFAITEYVTDCFFISVYALMLLYISVPITLIVLAVSLVAFYLMNRWLKRSSIYGRQLVDLGIEQNEFLSERLGLLRLIKTSSTEPGEVDHFRGISRRFGESYVGFGITGASIEILFQTIIFVIAVAVLFFSVNIFHIQLALLLLFLFVLVRIQAPLRDINSRRHELAREIPSFHKIDQLLTDVTAHRKVKAGPLPFPGFRREITLNHVSFSSDGQVPVLSDVSIRIPKNSMVALVGASGGGKSTVVDLITRLIDPDTGTILIDGEDLRNYTLESYRRKLGVVSQEILVFNDTVLANICYGSSEISLPGAMEAAKIANAHEFIMGLADRYDTLLGERGTKLSGGQKQRIALARAIYKNPEIFILDEATSSLDSESEKIIQDSISELQEKYTIITIAHRLSTVKYADCIVVIEKGRVVETGTHDELLAADGFYAKYYRMQVGGEASPNH